MAKGKGNSSCVLAEVASQELTSNLLALGIPDLYQVGGCVRDQLLGKDPKDFDFMACGLTPEELLSLCRQAGKAEELIVGEQLVGVRLTAPWTDRQGIEIALARQEISTGQGHLDFQITPSDVPVDLQGASLDERAGDPRLLAQAEADLARRDFTCNAIAQNLKDGELLDPYNGADDIAAGVLRVVSPESFRDDPLRMLRGIGRIAKDDLTPDPETASLAKQSASSLHSDPNRRGALSPERIQAELLKIMSGDHSAKALSVARDWGLWPGISAPLAQTISFDQQNRYHSLSLDDHTIAVLSKADQMKLSPSLKLAILFHDVGKPGTAKPGKQGGLSYYRADSSDPLWQSDPERAKSHEELGAEITRAELKRLAYPKKTVEHVGQLVRHHMFAGEIGLSGKPEAKQRLIARRMLAKHGQELSLELCKLRICDLAGKTEVPDGFDRDAKLLMQRIEEESSQPTRIKDLNIDGRRLQELGLQEGPEIQTALEGLLKIVVGDPGQNNPERIEKHAIRQIERLRDAA